MVNVGDRQVDLGVNVMRFVLDSMEICKNLEEMSKFFIISEKHDEALSLLHRRLVIYEKEGSGRLVIIIHFTGWIF